MVVRSLIRLSNRFHLVDRLKLSSPVLTHQRLLSNTTNVDDIDEKLLKLDTTDNANDTSEMFEGVPLLRRALIYCPGDDQHKINKVMSLGDSIDCIVLDCEDGVAINKKVFKVLNVIVYYYLFCW